MRTARYESTSGSERCIGLLWKLAYLGLLILLGNSAYGESACKTYGWGGADGNLFPSASAAAHSWDFSGRASDNWAIYEHFVGSYAGGSEAQHNIYFHIHEVDTVGGTPAFCIRVKCGVIDQGD